MHQINMRKHPRPSPGPLSSSCRPHVCSSCNGTQLDNNTRLCWVCYTARAGMQRYWYSASLETQGKSDKKTEGSIVKCGSHETFQQIKPRIKGDGKENPAEGQDCREIDDECG